MRLLFIGKAGLELFRLHAMRSVDARSAPVHAQRQQAGADLEVGRVASSREAEVASGASGLAERRSRPAEGHEDSE